MVGSFPLTRFMASVITLWQPAAQLPGLSASCTPLALAWGIILPFATPTVHSSWPCQTRAPMRCDC